MQTNEVQDLIAKLVEASCEVEDGSFVILNLTAAGAVIDPVQYASEAAAAGVALASDTVSDDLYVTKRFRFLSADTMIRPSIMGLPVQATIPAKVLQKATALWAPRKDDLGNKRNLTVYADHVRSVKEWVGEVLDAEFVEASDKLPAGVEGSIRFHRKAAANVAHGYEAGVLKAVSSGWAMKWHKSHPDMPMSEFFDAAYMGLEKDGKPVCMIADAITQVSEVSAVWEGGDRYAKSLASAVAAATLIDPPAPVADGGDEVIDDNHLQAGTPAQEEAMTEEFKAVLAALGLPEDAQAEDIASSLSEIQAAVAERDELKAKCDVMQASIEALTERATVAEAAVAAVEAAQAQAKREELIDGAIKAGRILPAAREQWMKLATSDMEATAAALEALPVALAVPTGDLPAAAPVEATAGLTEAEIDLAKRMNISVEKYAAEKAKGLKRGIV